MSQRSTQRPIYSGNLFPVAAGPAGTQAERGAAGSPQRQAAPAAPLTFAAPAAGAGPRSAPASTKRTARPGRGRAHKGAAPRPRRRRPAREGPSAAAGPGRAAASAWRTIARQKGSEPPAAAPLLPSGPQARPGRRRAPPRRASPRSLGPGCLSPRRGRGRGARPLAGNRTPGLRLGRGGALSRLSSAAAVPPSRPRRGLPWAQRPGGERAPPGEPLSPRRGRLASLRSTLTCGRWAGRDPAEAA